MANRLLTKIVCWPLGLRLSGFLISKKLAIYPAILLVVFSLLQAPIAYAEGVVCSPNATAEQKKGCYEYFQGNNVLFYDPYATDDCTSSTVNLSIEQKIGQLFILGFDTTDDSMLATMKKYNIGGAYFNGANRSPIAADKLEALNKSLTTDALMASDDEGGKVERFLNNQPSAHDMGLMTAAQLEAHGKTVGAALKSKGISMLLAPVLDIDGPNKDNATSGNSLRSFSSNPGVITEKAGAFAKGVTQGSVGVTFKHFPGLRITEKNTDFHYQKYTATVADLAQDIEPYKQLKDTDSASVMLANMTVSAWGDSPVSINAQAVDFLRNSVGFKGMITTDDLNALAKYTAPHAVPIEQSVPAALNAGVDMPLLYYPGGTTLDNVISAVKQKVTPDIIDTAFQHAIAYKSSIGLSTTRTVTTSGSSSSTAGDVRGENVEKVLSYMTGKGMTLAQASGLVGNMMQESTKQLNPRIIEGGATAPIDYTPVNGKGFGLVQWTFSDRQEPLVALAHSTGRKTTDIDAQLDYIIVELNGRWKSTIQALIAHPTATPTEAAIIFHGRTPKARSDPRFSIAPQLGYEASGDSPEDVVRVRGGNAESVYKAYVGKIPDGKGIGDGLSTDGNPLSSSGQNCGGSKSNLVASGSCSATRPITGEGGNRHQLTQEELVGIYGPPLPAADMKAKMVSVDFLGKSVFVHPLVAGCLKAVVDEIKANNINYVVKEIGGYRLDGTGAGQIGLRSYHTYGAALDINPSSNPYVSGGTAPHTIPQSYVDAFNHHGWSWGGNWGSVKDYMHFEYNGPVQKG